MAAFLLCASKKGISAHQMHRMLGITYKSAWFMMHRLREAMKPGGMIPFGSDGGAVEVDETYLRLQEGLALNPRGASATSIAIVALVGVMCCALLRSIVPKPLGSDDLRDVLFHHISRNDSHSKDR